MKKTVLIILILLLALPGFNFGLSTITGLITRVSSLAIGFAKLVIHFITSL